MSLITFDFKQAIPLIKHILRAQDPVMMRGRHGIGKSEVVYQVAGELDLPVVELRASQLGDVGDLVGMPRVDGDYTSFCPTQRLWYACNHACVFFLDEVDRGQRDIAQAFFELTDSRKIAGQHLHPDTLIIAACNGGERADAAQYNVNDLEPAELDRWTVFDVEPTVQDWLDWAMDGNVNKLITDFVVNEMGSEGCRVLEHIGDHQPNKVYPSRRSWKRLNDCLDGAGLLSKDNFDKLLIQNLSVGYIGAETAMSFLGYLETYQFEISLDDIILGKEEIDFSTFEVLEHTRFTEKAIATNYFKTLGVERLGLSASQADGASKLTAKQKKEMLRVANRVNDWMSSGTFPLDNLVNFWGDITSGFKLLGTTLHLETTFGDTVQTALLKKNEADRQATA